MMRLTSDMLRAGATPGRVEIDGVEYQPAPIRTAAYLWLLERQAIEQEARAALLEAQAACEADASLAKQAALLKAQAHASRVERETVAGCLDELVAAYGIPRAVVETFPPSAVDVLMQHISRGADLVERELGKQMAAESTEAALSGNRKGRGNPRPNARARS